MAHPKEECFETALADYQRYKGDMGVRWKQVWAQSTETGRWAMSDRGFFAEIGSQIKTKLFDAGEKLFPGLTRQVRVPELTVDITAATEAGLMAIDLKFTRPSGGVDDWGTQEGAGNGRTQLQDYNEINQQNNPGTDVNDPKLNPTTCNCGEGEGQRAAEPVEVMVSKEQLAQEFLGIQMPAPPPGVVPDLELPPLPRLPRLRLPRLRLPGWQPQWVPEWLWIW
jgi:hypothetical protein